MHPKTRRVLERMLRMLAEEGEEKTFACIRRTLVKGRGEKRMKRHEKRCIKRRLKTVRQRMA